ncbi:hypothetical protein [Kitasatospora sp. NPDC008115]|uniref:hypothetical protein n=1 Tax=Kitasatospora sp. NPDC008115 TaxID=3364022 RepID=UPI0036E88C86
MTPYPPPAPAPPDTDPVPAPDSNPSPTNSPASSPNPQPHDPHHPPRPRPRPRPPGGNEQPDHDNQQDPPRQTGLLHPIHIPDPDEPHPHTTRQSPARTDGRSNGAAGSRAQQAGTGGGAPAGALEQALAVLPPDTRPLPDTTANDKLLPSRHRTARTAAAGAACAQRSAGSAEGNAPPPRSGRGNATGGSEVFTATEEPTETEESAAAEVFAAAEAELLATAQALIGNPASGLSKTADRQLRRHLSAHARNEDLLLPHLRAAIADLAHRAHRLRLPDTLHTRRLRTALTTYLNAWNTAHTHP